MCDSVCMAWEPGISFIMNHLYSTGYRFIIMLSNYTSRKYLKVHVLRVMKVSLMCHFGIAIPPGTHISYVLSN